MRVVVHLFVLVIYIAVLSYLLLGALGFGFGLRIGGNVFADEGFGFQRTTYLVLLGLLVCGGLYSGWRIKRLEV